MMPSPEVVTQTVSTTVHQHTSKVFLLEVLLLCTVSQLVKCESLSPFHKSIKNKPNRLGAVLLRALILLTFTDSVLLPLLEAGCGVEVPHSLEDLGKLLASTFLE